VRNRIALVAVVATVFLLAGVLVQCSPGRQARVTATPTKTLRPTFTPTSDATPTPIPSPTSFPTLSPTPAPPTEMPAVVTTTITVTVPVATPLPTAAPTLRPPSATATRKPAATRTKTPTPKPTNTLAPPFTGKIVKGYARCDGYYAVTGFVTHANKSAYPGVSVGAWSDTWGGEVKVTEDSGKFDVVLMGMPFGKYYVAIVEPGTCQLPSASGCQRRSNVLEVTITQKCSGSGANQVTEVSFVGP